jgi:hypothetical protein
MDNLGNYLENLRQDVIKNYKKAKLEGNNIKIDELKNYIILIRNGISKYNVKYGLIDYIQHVPLEVDLSDFINVTEKMRNKFGQIFQFEQATISKIDNAFELIMYNANILKYVDDRIINKVNFEIIQLVRDVQKHLFYFNCYTNILNNSNLPTDWNLQLILDENNNFVGYEIKEHNSSIGDSNGGI